MSDCERKCPLLAVSQSLAKTSSDLEMSSTTRDVMTLKGAA